MARLSQETLAIIGATIAVAALILTTITGVRSEIQALRAEIQSVRAEARADRAEARAARQVFQEQILRLTEQQGILGGQVEIIRDQFAAGGWFPEVQDAPPRQNCQPRRIRDTAARYPLGLRLASRTRRRPTQKVPGWGSSRDVQTLESEMNALSIGRTGPVSNKRASAEGSNYPLNPFPHREGFFSLTG